MKRFVFSSFIALVFAAGAAVAGGDEPVIVEVKDFQFHPKEITVKVGTTIRWVNLEKRQYHSVWFKALGEAEGDYFWPEESYERTFKEPGDFPYVCEPHEQDGMIGTVHVIP